MKKNWFLRIAGIMLALAMITSCFVGSTFAKYITKATGEDGARVAKWGVLIGIEGTAFGDEYAAEDESYLDAGGEISVKSDNGDKVVAPGTSSELLDANLIAHVTGTPEVAARYTISGTIEDIYLEAGTYTDYTELVLQADGTYDYSNTFDLAKNYSPVKWNLEITKGSTTLNVADALYAELAAYPNLLAAAENYGLTPSGCSFIDALAILTKVASQTTYMDVIETVLGNVVSGGRNFQLTVDKDAGTFEMSYDFDPLKVMDFTFTLSWEWAFEQENYELFDKADTFLGNVAAGVVVDDHAHTELGANLTATAVQID